MKPQTIHFFLIIVLLASGCKTELDFGEPPRPDYDPLRDANIKPLVIETYPSGNSQGPYENFVTTIQLRFNKVMDMTTLRQAVHLSSSRNDVKIDPGTISTSDGVTFAVEAVRSDSPARFWWAVGQEYTLTVDSAAEDINKNMLSREFSMKFVPEPEFRLLAAYPPGGATDVPPDAVSGFLRLEFNSDLDTSMYASVNISPPCPGAWHLEDATKMYYRLFEELALNANYTVTVDPGAHDAYGNVIAQPGNFSFTTQFFRIEETFPKNGFRLIPATSSIAVRCNAPIDTGSVRLSFTCLPPIAGYFVFEEKQFYYVPYENAMQMSRFYKVMVRQSLQSVAGHRLATDYGFDFWTDAFKVLAVIPEHLLTRVSRATYIRVLCNARIRQSSVPTSFNIYPPVPGIFDSCYNGTCGGFDFYFFPSESLAAQTTYVINIGQRIGAYTLPTLLSQTGNGTSAQWWFTTGDD